MFKKGDEDSLSAIKRRQQATSSKNSNSSTSRTTELHPQAHGFQDFQIMGQHLQHQPAYDNYYSPGHNFHTPPQPLSYGVAPPGLIAQRYPVYFVDSQHVQRQQSQYPAQYQHYQSPYFVQTTSHQRHYTPPPLNPVHAHQYPSQRPPVVSEQAIPYTRQPSQQMTPQKISLQSEQQSVSQPYHTSNTYIKDVVNNASEMGRSISMSQQSLSRTSDNLKKEVLNTTGDVIKFSDSLPKLEPIIKQIDEENYQRIQDLKYSFKTRADAIQTSQSRPYHHQTKSININVPQPPIHHNSQPQLPFSTPSYFSASDKPEINSAHASPSIESRPRIASFVDPLAKLPHDHSVAPQNSQLSYNPLIDKNPRNLANPPKLESSTSGNSISSTSLKKLDSIGAHRLSREGSFSSLRYHQPPRSLPESYQLRRSEISNYSEVTPQQMQLHSSAVKGSLPSSSSISNPCSPRLNLLTQGLCS
ncbi:hypothetical protein DASC09_001000 [Saccharomycopsis crataegensis]|uniref:Uncharacterized protein n=1 Tax=Saccharomycopsis crataegensis TaxID=43959 RepID=A0AAV5QE94_9ASCO|nr:hypothetical protein DASC09_001000 [Saccharomycopsis crataegensis]